MTAIMKKDQCICPMMSVPKKQIRVSSCIAEILKQRFHFRQTNISHPSQLLFQSGIYKHAGKIRDYNITKKEWVLDGATVMYGSASELRATLEYDFS